MKKFKIAISIILVMMLAITSSVTAFATTDEELKIAKSNLEYNVDHAELIHIQYGLTEPSLSIPTWSYDSSLNLENVIETIRNGISSCETIDEVNEYQAMLDEAIENLCVSEHELRWMLNYMLKDYNNSTNYYDAETYAELKTIYENAQKALESGVDLDIHNAYIDMRNELNKLCAYNSVKNDVDNDGVFSIKDCTLMQMQIAELIELTSSQRYVAFMDHTANITDVTNAQMMLAKYTDYPYEPTVNTDFAELDPSIREFYNADVDYESSNWMYYSDCYIWWT